MVYKLIIVYYNDVISWIKIATCHQSIGKHSVNLTFIIIGFLHEVYDKAGNLGNNA